MLQNGMHVTCIGCLFERFNAKKEREPHLRRPDSPFCMYPIIFFGFSSYHANMLLVQYIIRKYSIQFPNFAL